MGSSSKKVTVGYRYYLGVHNILCHGPIDSLSEIIVGERSAWTGNVTSNTTIQVDAAELFGGEDREGGVAGPVDIMMGAITQPVNSYLAGLHGPDIPAYRGVVSAVFRQFYWAAMNPYFKAPWFRVRRVLAGWSTGAPWYAAKAAIGPFDMNPAHIIYESLTNTDWGMGYGQADIGNSFTVAADRLYDEEFGLSMAWSDQATIQEFIAIVLDHINGTLRLDLTTGKFELQLIRDDYDIDDLLDRELSPSNILEFNSFQRASWGDTANEITVIYTGRDGEELPITVQDPASIEAQGAVVPTTREYRGVRENSLAVRLAMRDLNTSTSPMAKVSLICNRIAWDWDIGDVFPLSWPRLGLNRVPMRVVRINKGNIVSGRIEIEAVEDIFGLPTNAYTAQPPSGWVDPISQPLPVVAPRAIEAPYWEIVQNFSAADIDYMEPFYGYGTYLAVKPSSDAYNFELQSSPSSGGSYLEVSRGDFSPTGTLSLAMGMPTGALTTTVQLSNAIDLDSIDLGGYGYIDNEAVQVVAVNATTNQITIERGVLDTVPATHAAGARFYYADGYAAADPTQRVTGQSVWYKALTQTGYGRLPIASATPTNLVFANRASRPYPPGQFRFNSTYYPVNVTGDVVLTWAHRDRLQQTVDLVDYSEGSIGPEVGTTYTVRLYNGASLLRTYSAVSGTTWTYPANDVIADGYLQTVRLRVASVVGGVESWQQHDHTTNRYGLGYRLGESLGGSVPA